ncbi:hypothetical protein QBC45DRAFT_318360 [Copromyces sp. CBS 386.78]|nr:hypothetical protein QBC45DRAFT_318360 [Copromyces sp. CBS 386.78]
MYKLPNCHLSELALVVDSASPEVQLHHGDTQKSRHKEAKKPRANQSRHRRPAPYNAFAVEHYRHEGDSSSEDDGCPDDPLRGRSRSSTWTPTRTRAPTPHPNASRSRRRDVCGKKTVQWADELEQESPEQKSEPATATLRTKSAMKRGPAKTKSTEKEKDRGEHSSAEPAKSKMDQETTLQDVQTCALRRDRRSSIPRLKFAVTVSRSNTTNRMRIAARDRPPSPLIPQAVPAPLRISPRRSHKIPAIPPSSSAPEATCTDKISTALRDFSFDDKPEVIIVGFSSAHQGRLSTTTKNDLPPPPRSTSSYLQAKPRRHGTTRTCNALHPKSEKEPARTEDSSGIKNSSSTVSAQARSITRAASLPKSPSTHKDPMPSSTSVPSFQSAKSFWSDLSASSSCAAVSVVSGFSPSSKPTSTLSRNTKDLPRTSMMSSLSTYTGSSSLPCRPERNAMSGEYTSSSKASTSHCKSQERAKAIITASSSAVSCTSMSSYHTANSHLGGCNASSDINSGSTSSISTTATSSSMGAEHIPSIHSDLWNEIMDFCRSDSSSLTPGAQHEHERYCDCDDCVWSNGKNMNLTESNTVARRVGNEKESERCRERK